MEITPRNRIHPLIAAAAIAIILVCLVGVAAITGLIPGSKSANAPPNTAEPVQLSSAEKIDIEREAAKTPKAAKSTNTEPLSASSASSAPPPPADICESCGRVESIRAIKHTPKTSGVGIAAGAVLGGLLGNQIGSGNGRLLGTVAGAAGGGYAGNEVEKRTHTTTTYDVIVRMENGKVRTFPQSSSTRWQVGDHVRVVDGALHARG
jgi:outer membrane lipoprotein SlyB